MSWAVLGSLGTLNGRDYRDSGLRFAGLSDFMRADAET